MTNEHILLREIAVPVSGTVDDSIGFLKGTVLKIADPNTVSASDGNNDEIAGIASQEKIASNGQTKNAFYDKGDFRGILSGSATTGDPLGSWGREGINQIYSLIGVTNLSGNCVLGTAKEDGTDGQTIRYKLDPQAIMSA